MGLLSPFDWKAEWIGPDLKEDKSSPQQCPMLRKAFRVEGSVRSARTYVTSLGLYELELNGRRVGDQVLTPGWTSYDKRLQYQTYDLTELLQEGENAVGARLGDGWYRGYLGFRNNRNLYGDTLALLLQIEITYKDGRTQHVATDGSWRSATGPILYSDIYKGESYDARLEKALWSRAGYDDSGWSGVRVISHSKEILVAPPGPPVRKVQEIRPIRILKTPKGETVFDFGQNMVGWVRLRVRGNAGDVTTLRHAEVLDKEGNFYVANLRAAEQTARYTLKGGGEEVYEPHFTFQGFRYVAVEGYPGEPSLSSLTGIVIHSDMTPTGGFECSSPLINQLQKNIVWGQKGNFVDVPTDCPQRDERLGWTGDAQVFIRTACFNMDVAAFFAKWLKDLAADQNEEGSVPFVVPDALSKVFRSQPPGGGFNGFGSTAWADAAVICPWTVYLCYGDRRILEEQYDSMAKWVAYMQKQAGEAYIWNTGFHFGDWLAIFPESNPLIPPPRTPNDLIATAFFAYSTSILEQTARVLGKKGDAKAYGALLKKIKKAFCEEFVSKRGRMDSNTQTAYVLALMFDLLPEGESPKAAKRLVDDIRKRGNHLSTGFVGTPYLCHVLSQNGYLDVAYDLLAQETFPSWLYPIKMGSTTIWERWDGIKPDGSFQDASMNSFNHYAYGAIGHWLYSVVGGHDVDPDAPGYKHVLIGPQLGGGLTYARTSVDSMYGKITSDWKLTEKGFRLDVAVPPNTHATVRIPASSVDHVTESGRPLSGAEGVESAHQDGKWIVVEVGSGDFIFEAAKVS